MEDQQSDLVLSAHVSVKDYHHIPEAMASSNDDHVLDMIFNPDEPVLGLEVKCIFELFCPII